MSYGADPHIKSVTGHRPIDLVTDVKTFDLLVKYQKNVGFFKYEFINKYNIYENIDYIYH